MLLSNPATSAYIRDHFVPVWQKVRDVPVVQIDFKNGKKLTRTLAGNTVMSICNVDGTVIDALPGVVTPEDFKSVSKSALDEFHKLQPLAPGARTAELVRYHRSKMVDLLTEDYRRVTVGKAVVEAPLLSRLGFSYRPMVVQGSAVSPSIDQAAPLEVYRRISKEVDDLSKSPFKAQAYLASVKTAQQKMTEEELAAFIVADDSRRGLKVFQPAIHDLLSSMKKPPTPMELSPRIYKELLHIDIDDPYLGLAEIPIPGSPRN